MKRSFGFLLIAVVLILAPSIQCQNDAPVQAEEKPEVPLAATEATVAAEPEVQLQPTTVQAEVPVQQQPPVPASYPPVAIQQQPVAQPPAAQPQLLPAATPVGAFHTQFRALPAANGYHHFGYQVPSAIAGKHVPRMSYPTPYHGVQRVFLKPQAVQKISTVCQEFAKRDASGSGEPKKDNAVVREFESWFMNIINHDVVFSVCGTIIPGHRILLESGSPRFSVWIQARNNQTDGEQFPKPIPIHDVANLIDGTESSDAGECSDPNLLTAFKHFLQFFYSGSKAFDNINDLDVSFLVWRLGNAFLDRPVVMEHIEPKIASLITTENLSRVYEFIRQNKVETLKPKWSQYIADHSDSIANTEPLPLRCPESQSDIELMDHFLESLNTTQARVISIIRYYLENCPNTTKELIVDAGSFPRSLFFYRCTVDDLKNLVQLKFINHAILAEELENRLTAQEKLCEEIKKSAAVAASYHHHHHYGQQQPTRSIPSSESYMEALRRRA